MAIERNSTGKTNSIFPRIISFSWNIKKKRSPRKEYFKTHEEKKINYEDIENEIKYFSKDKKEEKEFMELADLLYFMRSIKKISQEEIIQIKRNYMKVEEIERKVEPRLKRINKKKNSSKFSKRKIKKEKVQRVISERLVLEAEKREQNPPLVVVKKMKSMNGSNLKFLMKKNLEKTDTSKWHDRLSMPKIQIAREFLNEQEIKEIKNGFIAVVIIEPCGLESSLKLTIWSSGSDVYVLRSVWRNIALREENGLKVGIGIDIWCFRDDNNQLCLQILKTNHEAHHHNHDLQIT